MRTRGTDDNKARAVAIGDRLREQRQRLGLSQLDFAEAVGVSKTTQFNYETGARSPDAEYLLNAGEQGVDITFVLLGQPAQSKTGVFVEVKQLRGGGDDTSLAVPKGWIARRGLTEDQLATVVVRGSSMDGVLWDGDRVLVDRSDVKPRSGFVYAIRQGDELLTKYCEQLPGGLLRVSSANQSFQPYDVRPNEQPDFEVVGRVVQSSHDW